MSGIRSIPLGRAAVTPAEGLRAALAVGAVRFDRQPIVALPQAVTAGYELLARFDLPFAVADIVAAAEAENLVEKIDIAAAQAALQAMDRGGLFYSVNVSARSLASPAFCDRILRMLRAAPGQGCGMIFEVTETARIVDLGAAAETLNGLRGLGAQIWLDDFGEGFGALSYLRTLPADGVKLRAHAGDWLIGPLVRMVGELGLSAVVEMVETEAQARTAVQAGAAFGQGYLFGRPQRWQNVAAPQRAFGA
jgi:EAL domain-containing protein (putative c-di-GMP-specific phosphodiesterase class I)